MMNYILQDGPVDTLTSYHGNMRDEDVYITRMLNGLVRVQARSGDPGFWVCSTDEARDYLEAKTGHRVISYKVADIMDEWFKRIGVEPRLPTPPPHVVRTGPLYADEPDPVAGF